MKQFWKFSSIFLVDYCPLYNNNGLPAEFLIIQFAVANNKGT